MHFVPDQYKMQEKCNKVIEKNPWSFAYVPYCLKTQKMCKRVVEKVHKYDYSQFVNPGPWLCNDELTK